MKTTLMHWITAFRLRTLPLAFSSILMGTSVALREGMFDPLIFALALLTTLFLQILSNLANDYGDANSGVDSEDRMGPSRTVQSGLISKAKMKNALYVFAILSFISGVSMLLYVFPKDWQMLIFFLLLGASAIWAAIKYTVGDKPYGYAGFGDVFVLLFFGIVGVIGTYYLFTKSYHPQLILPAFGSGLLAVGVLNINNIRDIESDEAAGKRSIPVRLGKKRATIYHFLLLSNAMAALLIFSLTNELPVWSYSFLLVTPLFMINAKAVHNLEGKALDPYLKQLAISILILTFMFGIGINLPVWLK
jgi:1,4-dihydroxy-2-naphthoate octaprenyltransferase